MGWVVFTPGLDGLSAGDALREPVAAGNSWGIHRLRRRQSRPAVDATQAAPESPELVATAKPSNIGQAGYRLPIPTVVPLAPLPAVHRSDCEAAEGSEDGQRNQGSGGECHRNHGAQLTAVVHLDQKI